VVSTAIQHGDVVIDGSELVKSFRRGAEIVHALRGAALTVRAGEMLGISGASGSGKSTLLAVLCGWEQPESGTVVHPGGPVADLPWSELALVPQTLGLLEDLTVEENIKLGGRLAPRQDRRNAKDDAGRAHELMDRLGLRHLAARFPKAVSVGEQQRTAMARALYLRPRLLLADEPTAHQDRGWGQAVLDAMRDHADTGGGMIVVSHDPQTLDFCDRVLIMVDGVLG
jgi:ABC-type lipoprotein export system ATPase subunit